jgi:uncharacterized protein YndB with AHSA1/START domain
VATTTITPDKNAVVSEIEIAAPPERVFQALTQSDQLMRWWTNDVCKAELWELDARPGGRWRCRQKSDTMSINGTNVFEVEGEILEIDPPRLLVYTWSTNWDSPSQSTSVVRWELTPSSAGTKVKMTHSGLTPESAQGYSDGWPGVVEMLKKFVEK